MNWIPAISTAGLLGVVLWLARNMILTRLTKGVEHEFDKKLETLRADFRRGEEQLRADLRVREIEIGTLRSGAMSALASRQAAVDKRRLEAIDQLWAATIALGPARAISSFMAVIKFDAAAKEAEHNAKFRQVMEMLGSGFDLKSIGGIEAQKARPYVSPMAWATYSALLSIASFAVMRWHILKSGISQTDFVNKDTINKLLKTALPHQSAYIDTIGESGYHFLLEELETKLLGELQKMLAGTDSDKANLEQAADILKQSDDLMNQVKAKTNIVQPSTRSNTSP